MPTRNYATVKKRLQESGYYLDVPEEGYKGVTITKLKCHDEFGYKYSNVCYDAAVRNGLQKRLVHPTNTYSIYNINLYLQKEHLPFMCISKEYNSKRDKLEFVCLRCGKHVFSRWDNINQNGQKSESRFKLRCENCDGRLESLHAIVLKQMFMHYHPDTILEEKSCRNPLTNKIMPTDIVNDRLKIAIEIESQWHDYADRKVKDGIKRNYWLSRGYSFYDPDIRDYTILEMCQLFFDVNEIPDFIDYNYSNKLNIKEVQKLLNDGFSVPQAANLLDVNKHRIYDAIYAKQLYYPDDYVNKAYVKH